MTAEMIDKLVMYFQYPFVQKAMIAGVLIALCSSLLGVTLVLKRFSFIGDGLSHVAFGALSAATVLGFVNQMIVVMPVTMFVAWLLLAVTKRRKIMGDASLAMLSVGALGFGYLVMNKFSKGGNVSSDVCSTLFGSTSILTLSDFDLWTCVIMSVVVIAVFMLFYNRIFSVTFDPDFASATGTRAGFYNTLIALITAAVIVLAMNLVGSLLISALVVFPAISAMRVFKSFRSVVICSAVISVLSSAAGIVASMLFYNRIFSVTFDPDFASATGTRAGFYNTLIALITAAVIVLAMNLVGSLLISALVVFPAISAMRVFKSFRSVVVCSAVISVLSSAAGIVASILFSTPVGSTIVAAQILVFLVFSVAGLFSRRRTPADRKA